MFNYNGQESEKTTCFWVYDSNTPVTLKQGWGHQIQYELVDPKQGYNNTKFEKLCLNSVHKNKQKTPTNFKVFVISSIISFEYVWKYIYT